MLVTCSVLWEVCVCVQQVEKGVLESCKLGCIYSTGVLIVLGLKLCLAIQ